MKTELNKLAIHATILVLALFLITGCSSQTQEQEDITAVEEQESQSEEMAQVPEEKEQEDIEEQTPETDITGFVPDGVISQSEYSREKDIGDVLVAWSTDGEYLYMALSAETEGYISIGFEPTEAMKDADMIFGYVEGTDVTVLDLYSTGNFGPHPPDTELGGTDDMVEFGGAEDSGKTVIEFKRLLSTGDEFDHEIKSGTLKVIWAYGNADDLDRSHSKRGSGEIEID